VPSPLWTRLLRRAAAAVVAAQLLSAEARLSLLVPKDPVSCDSETEVCGVGEQRDV